MTTISTSPRTSIPRVNLERKGAAASTRENSRVAAKTTADTPASPTTTQRPSLASSNKRFSGIQSKVGSLEHIDYKPKPSEKKIQTFKQDFSHIKSKVDAKMVLPTPSTATATTDPTSVSKPRVTTTRTAVAVGTAAGGPAKGTAAAKGPTVVTAVSTASWNDSIKPSSASATTRPGRISIRAAGPQSTAAVISTGSNKASSPSTPMSPPHSRRSSTSSVGMANPPVSPAGSNPRRLSKHIIPTQKAHYDHVKSKVGSLDNIGYAKNNTISRDRASSCASSADGDNVVSKHGRSNSMSAVSSTSSTTSQTTNPGRRSSFRIPPSKKVDYTQVRSKVGSLDYIHHTPQGGNLRVFSEKLTFREQAQSKVAKEINIVQFYQNSDQSFEEDSVQDQDAEGGEQDSEQQQQQVNSSILYCSSEANHSVEEDYEPPKNILAVLEEVTESVAELDFENPQQHGQQQANDDNHHHHHHDTRLESIAAL